MKSVSSIWWKKYARFLAKSMARAWIRFQLNGTERHYETNTVATHFIYNLPFVDDSDFFQ